MRGNRLKLWLLMLAFIVAGVYIVGPAARSMIVDADYWTTVRALFTHDSIPLEALRGNILSSDGKVMVTSVPEYRLLMDFVVIDRNSANREKAQAWRDSALRRDIDSIAQGLASIFPDRDARWFKERIMKGRERGSHAWRIYPRLATYSQYLECKKLPLLREGQYTGGFSVEKSMQRKKLYGSLASRTLGDVYRDSDAAKSGLEWCYDTLLRGRNGYAHRTKVLNKWLAFTDVEPQNGHDIVSTIDVRLQDIVEKALLDKLAEPAMSQSAERAVAILMEVPTGDIKAMLSLARTDYGFQEVQNDAINALWEPGSTFKTASMMVALEDGYVTPSTVVNCENGVFPMYGRFMRDHNWRKNGYQDLTITQIIGNSSNIGVSKTIDKYYHDQPEKFVQGLYNLGVGIKYNLPMGADPKVRMPAKVGHQYTNWSKTALPWMSIGYEVQLTPLNTLTFYNAIANGGKMVRPRFVTKELDRGKVVREFPVEVIKEKICSDKTLSEMQTILEKVVSQGLGAPAGNRKFKVSGKTGTAQVAENGSYEGHKYMITFCGYFPSEAPQYSCIVCIYKRGSYLASGGGQCGPVFSRISQQVMNEGPGKETALPSDSAELRVPSVARGDMDETRQLLSMMSVPWQNGSDARWGEAEIDTARQRLLITANETSAGTVPDVRGMGARDAVYALRDAGMRVSVEGSGRVTHQSIAPGTAKAKGQTIAIQLR